MSVRLDELASMIATAVKNKINAEIQKAKYEKLVALVNIELNRTRNFDYVKEHLTVGYDYMEEYPHAAAGKIRTTFDGRENASRIRKNIMQNNLTNGLSSIQTQLRAANEQYQHWCDEAENWNKDIEEYQRQYVAEQEAERQRQAEAARQREIERQRQEEAKRREEEQLRAKLQQKSGIKGGKVR